MTAENITIEFDELVSKAELFVEHRNHEALPLAEELMQMAIRYGDPMQFARAKYVLAFYHCVMANDYEKAIGYCQEILHKLDTEQTAEILYKIYMTMGNSYQLKGEVFLAHESYLKGIKLLESKKDPGIREKKFMASFYYNLSLVFNGTELDISTEDYLEKAIRIYEEMDNGFYISKSYMAYAGVFERKKEYRKAIELLYKSLEIDLRLNDAYCIALSKANLGILHTRVGNFAQALFYIKDALDFYEGKNMVYETAMVKRGLAESLCVVGKLTQGIAQFHEAEELFNRLDNKRELVNVYELLSKYLEVAEDFQSALEYHRKYTDGLKYFFDVEKTKALAHAKKEFETEQKEKEAAILKEKNEEIGHYVVKLESSNNALKQFAHVASHDLREPLRMISAYMGLLKKSMDGNLNDQQTEFMSYAMDGARRMENMIHDMLRLAKVDANPHIEKVRLNILVEEVKMNLEVLIKDKNAMVVYDDLPELMADRTMMLQLLQNIIGNGIKYNENPAPLIQVKHKLLRNTIEISIQDNGIGIPANLREKAFQLFQRLHTQKAYTGSGIGLAICKKIVESMAGHIQIEDNPSGGSIFRMTFPLSVGA